MCPFLTSSARPSEGLCMALLCSAQPLHLLLRQTNAHWSGGVELRLPSAEEAFSSTSTWLTRAALNREARTERPRLECGGPVLFFHWHFIRADTPLHVASASAEHSHLFSSDPNISSFVRSQICHCNVLNWTSQCWCNYNYWWLKAMAY